MPVKTGNGFPHIYNPINRSERTPAKRAPAAEKKCAVRIKESGIKRAYKQIFKKSEGPPAPKYIPTPPGAKQIHKGFDVISIVFVPPDGDYLAHARPSGAVDASDGEESSQTGNGAMPTMRRETSTDDTAIDRILNGL
jgi:hypothetical protein